MPAHGHGGRTTTGGVMAPAVVRRRQKPYGFCRIF
jgi:hypothetical protein